MMTEEKREYEVTILSRDQVSIFPKVGEEVKQLLVTYVGAGLPPATVTIDKEKYTEDLEKKLIRADIERRQKRKPTVIKV